MNLSEKLISKIISKLSISTLEWLETKIRQAFFIKKAFVYCWPNNYFPPWRFSAGDIENCGKAIFDLNRECRVLILDPVPELRNLTVSMGFKPELSVDGNFDVVLSDIALNMVKVEDDFLKGIKNILFPDGIFVVRFHFLDGALLELTAEEILEKSLGILDDRLAANAISGRIFDKFSDFKDAIEFIREAVKLAEGKPRRKLILLRALGLMLNGSRIRKATHNKIQLENLLAKFFDIIDVKIAGDYPDSKFYPVYVLKIRL